MLRIPIYLDFLFCFISNLIKVIQELHKFVKKISLTLDVKGHGTRKAF